MVDELSTRHAIQKMSIHVDPSNRPSQHLLWIDSLRGIAVIGVIAVHVSQIANASGILGSALSFGAKGVQLFYVVSALTLMMSMERRSKLEPRPLLNYFVRRFFRIAPSFYCVLLIYFILGRFASAQFSWVERTSVSQVLAVASFLNGWRPDWINSPVVGQWSIAVEMTFYLLLACIFPWVVTFRRAVIAWWASVVIYMFTHSLAGVLAAVEGFGGPSSLVSDFEYWWFPSQLPVFMCGIGLYFAMKEKVRWRWLAVAYLPGALLVAIVHRLHPDTGLVPVLGVAIMMLVAAISRQPQRWIVNKFTAFLGKTSFSAYLCHPLVIMGLDRLGGGKALVRIHNIALRFSVAYLAVIVFAIPISVLMWRYIEVPGQNLGRRIIAHGMPSRSAKI